MKTSIIYLFFYLTDTLKNYVFVKDFPSFVAKVSEADTMLLFISGEPPSKCRGCVSEQQRPQEPPEKHT